VGLRDNLGNEQKIFDWEIGRISNHQEKNKNLERTNADQRSSQKILMREKEFH